MKTPKRIALHIENLKGTLEVSCPDCLAPTRLPIEESASLIKCQCGLIYYLSEAQLKDLRKTQEEIKQVRQSFERPL